jgi:hypothetical protein
MTLTTEFIIYSAMFRLAIIAAGMLAIILGYLLFIKDPVGQGKTTTLLETGGFTLALKNFWPGSYFALFGTCIIGLMLWQGNPELITQELKTIEEIADGSEGRVQSTQMVAVRGECDDIDACWKMLSNPRQTLGEAALPISRIGTMWRQEGRIQEGLSMARLAAQIEPKNASYLAELAHMFLENKEPKKALQVMEAAAVLDRRYEQELADLKSRFQ